MKEGSERRRLPGHRSTAGTDSTTGEFRERFRV